MKVDVLMCFSGMCVLRFLKSEMLFLRRSGIILRWILLMSLSVRYCCEMFLLSRLINFFFVVCFVDVMVCVMLFMMKEYVMLFFLIGLCGVCVIRNIGILMMVL